MKFYIVLALVALAQVAQSTPFSCSSADTEEHCVRASHYGCHWTSSTQACSFQACSVRHSLADCIKSAGCRWLTSDDTCHDTSSFPITESEVCDTLNADDESFFSRMEDCIQYSDACEWQSDTSRCIPNRNKYCVHSGH